MRKIIQLVDSDPFMWALCDDGTVWLTKNTNWIRMTDVPQEGDSFKYLGES